MRLLLAALLVVATVAPAWAWTVPDTLTWAAVPNAASYKVEKTTDAGATWTSIGTPSAPTLVYNGTDAGLVLYRVSACGAANGGSPCTVRPEVGLWHNEAWRALAAPGSLGTQ